VRHLPADVSRHEVMMMMMMMMALLATAMAEAAESLLSIELELPGGIRLWADEILSTGRADRSFLEAEKRPIDSQQCWAKELDLRR
jgi:hypothetical protein